MNACPVCGTPGAGPVPGEAAHCLPNVPGGFDQRTAPQVDDEDEEELGDCEYHSGGAGWGCDRVAVTRLYGEDLCASHVAYLYGADPEEKD